MSISSLPLFLSSLGVAVTTPAPTTGTTNTLKTQTLTPSSTPAHEDYPRTWIEPLNYQIDTIHGSHTRVRRSSGSTESYIKEQVDRINTYFESNGSTISYATEYSSHSVIESIDGISKEYLETDYLIKSDDGKWFYQSQSSDGRSSAFRQIECLPDHSNLIRKSTSHAMNTITFVNRNHQFGLCKYNNSLERYELRTSDLTVQAPEKSVYTEEWLTVLSSNNTVFLYNTNTTPAQLITTAPTNAYGFNELFVDYFLQHSDDMTIDIVGKYFHLIVVNQDNIINSTTFNFTDSQSLSANNTSPLIELLQIESGLIEGQLVSISPIYNNDLVSINITNYEAIENLNYIADTIFQTSSKLYLHKHLSPDNEITLITFPMDIMPSDTIISPKSDPYNNIQCVGIKRDEGSSTLLFGDDLEWYSMSTNLTIQWIQYAPDTIVIYGLDNGKLSTLIMDTSTFRENTTRLDVSIHRSSFSTITFSTPDTLSSTLTSSPSSSLTSTRTTSPSSSLTSSQTSTPSSSITSTRTTSPSSSLTSSPTSTPSSSITSTRTTSPSSSLTSSPTATPSSSITSTRTISPSSSLTSSPSSTKTTSLSSSLTSTPTSSPTSTLSTTPNSSIDGEDQANQAAITAAILVSILIILGLGYIIYRGRQSNQNELEEYINPMYNPYSKETTTDKTAIAETTV